MRLTAQSHPISYTATQTLQNLRIILATCLVFAISDSIEQMSTAPLGLAFIAAAPFILSLALEKFIELKVNMQARQQAMNRLIQLFQAPPAQQVHVRMPDDTRHIASAAPSAQ